MTDLLDGPRLLAVAEVWRREKRVIETGFGGTSMLPAIAPGATIRIECGVDFAVGDVVLYVSGSRVVLHRVTRVSGALVWTRGDANRIPDPPIARDAVIGRAAVPAFAPKITLAESMVRLAERIAGPRAARVAVSALWSLRWPLAVLRSLGRRRV